MQAFATMGCSLAGNWDGLWILESNVWMSGVERRLILKQSHLILGIGELLWDVLPDGMRLGGAPANFAVMAARLGNHAAILSRIGDDKLGEKAVELLNRLPADACFLQMDLAHETGRVTVEFEGGQPCYTIHQPAAWDFLEMTDEWMQLAEKADAICFGSLAQRSLHSRRTIQELVGLTPTACLRICDVNLRAPFISREVIRESLELANVLKMNDAEAPHLLALLSLSIQGESLPGSLLRTSERLLAEFQSLQMVAVTRGGHGSLLATREEVHEHPGIHVSVADTIGAGDAFTAAMTHYLLRGASLARQNEAGNRWGAWVASRSGAMPVLPEPVRAQITAAIES
jgi:fructokinase